MEESVTKHFRGVLKLRQKQVSIKRFLVKMEKRPSGDLHTGASTEKHLKKDTEKVGEEQTSEPRRSAIPGKSNK